MQLECVHFAVQSNLRTHKFPNRGAGRVGKPLGGALIGERAILPSSGFLQIENWTICG